MEKIINERAIKTRQKIQQQEQIRMTEINKYISFKTTQKNNNSYNPDMNGKKYLVIMACHTSTKLKLEVLRKNLKYFSFNCVDTVVVNSKNLPFNNQVTEICNNHSNVKYYEKDNEMSLDFGKWYWILPQLEYDNYDYIILTNDSFIIENPINHYLNLMHKFNVDLYGYNDSTQIRYHYQSYLFGLKRNAIPVFLNRVKAALPQMKSYMGVVLNCEVKLTDWFPNHKCFLKIGEHPLNRDKNIFVNNNKVYFPLKARKILPFTKVKSLQK
jgi:hypothetical protein